jgi:hypothetical protein
LFQRIFCQAFFGQALSDFITGHVIELAIADLEYVVFFGEG